MIQIEVDSFEKLCYLIVEKATEFNEHNKDPLGIEFVELIAKELGIPNTYTGIDLQALTQMNCGETLWRLTEEDANMVAEVKYGRQLTDDELYDVSKGIEWGMEGCWTEILEAAIEEAIDNPWQGGEDESH